LSIKRKLGGVGLSATLLASLFATAAAPFASAAVTVTGVGSVPRGGTSAGPATFVLTEQSAAALATNAAGSIQIALTDSAASTTTVTFTGTPSASGPGSLGTLSASASGNTLTISWTNTDPLNVESITVTGLSIQASTTAALGAITATLGGATGNASVAAFQAGGTASGVLAAGVAIGGTSATVNVTTTGCAFVNTGSGSPAAGSFAFAAGAAGTSAESLAGTASALPAPPAAQQQTLTITTAGGFTSIHNAGDVVTQTNACAPNGVLTSPGSVVDSLIYNAPAAVTSIFPGENNQAVANLTATERTAGFLSVGTTVTFTISTAGVTFSNAPTISATNGLVFGSVTLSADRKSASATVTTASGAPSTLTLSNIRYDVASTVPSGTSVSVTLALSGSKVVIPTSRSNAQVGRIFNATAAPLPNVNIGQNAQATGLISITEVGAGSFTAGSGPNNVFEICLDGTGSFTSPGPWARVSGGTAAGNLILREGATASPDNIVQGTPDPSNPGCFYWTVWTASTAASTIQIGNESFTSGPLVNVNNNVAPGPLNANLTAGSLGALTLQVQLPIANRVFASQVRVTAASQPIMAPGATNALAGNILVEETGNGQLKLGQTICVEVVPNQQTNVLNDVFLTGLTTADLPVATGANGIVVSAVSMSPNTCSGLVGLPGTAFESFQFTILQQSTTGNGRVTISNIHYNVLNDAASGPVQVNVWGVNVGGASIDFQRVVSNAQIGNPVAGTAATRIGVTQVGAFTTATKVVRRGNYVTYRFDFGTAAAGDPVQIWAATKTGNDWSAFAVVTTRIANSSGVVYYYIRQSSAVWKSYRAFWVEGGSWTPARQARWV